MKINCSLVLFSAFLLLSCVPSKDLIYLQDRNGSQTTATVNHVALKPYRLQINDIMQVTVRAKDSKLVEVFNIGNPEQAIQTDNMLYYNGYTVDDHGNIRMPLLNEINVLGLTVDEVRKKVESRLLDEFFTKEASIFVSVKLAGFRYTINGDVVQPGTKVMMVEKLNIMEAIANAGDILVTGNRKKVRIIRQLPQGAEIHTIDLTDSKAMNSPYYFLQPNDYIYIEPLPQKVWGTGTTGIQSLTTVLTAVSLLATVLLIFVR
jgi:polysaccharide export outer membrane protein